MKWQSTPVFLPGESHGRRSLVGYSPKGRKEYDTTERLNWTEVAKMTSCFNIVFSLRPNGTKNLRGKKKKLYLKQLFILYAQNVWMLSRFSHVRLFATQWTVTLQAPPSMGFSRQEYWSGVLFPSLGALADPGIKLTSVMSPVLAGRFFTSSHLGNSYVQNIRQLIYFKINKQASK